MSTNGNGVRYNKEYFGYLVGFPDGKIIMTEKGAGPLLESGAPYHEINQYRLEQLEIPEGFYLNTPPLVWLEITKNCNLKCPHCYIDGGEKERMNFLQIKLSLLLMIWQIWAYGQSH